MATPKFTAYALDTLPVSDIDTGGVYYIKGVDDTFNIHIRNNGNTAWHDLGLTAATVDTVNNLTGDVKVDLDFTSGKLKITATGDGTESITTEVDLDLRYRELSKDIPWGDISGAPTFALDDEVLHKTGNETKTDGVLTFAESPIVPTPTTNTQAVNKKYVDDEITTLEDLITDIEQTVGTGVNIIDEIDASTNPNFPANPEGTLKGDAWIITKAGKIGGAGGRQVDKGNMIIAKVDGARAGDYATSEDDWIIMQSDLDQATELIKGFARIATTAEAKAGTSDSTIITPLKLKQVLEDLEEWTNDRFVRYDIDNQSLSTTFQDNARTNIYAASQRDVEWVEKQW